MSFFSFLGRPGSLPSQRVGELHMVCCIPFIPSPPRVAVGLSAYIALALPWALSRKGASCGRSLRPSAFRVSAARNAGCNPCRVRFVAKCKKEKSVLLLFVRTRGRDRTGTSVTSSVFETDASTYSATWASVLFQAAKIQLFSMQMQPPSKIFGIIHLSL